MKFPPFFAGFILAGAMTIPVFAQSTPAPGAVPAPAATRGPQMTFDTNRYEFGKVNMGTQVRHTYMVRNTGDQPLVISAVSPGCHCTTAGDWTHQVAPGQTGEIPIKFDSGGIHGDVTRTITVTSNGKPAPIQTLYLHGTVWQEIQITPMNAYMTVTPDSDTPASATVHISNQGAELITLSDPTSPNHMFKSTIKTIQPGKEFDLTVTAEPPFPPGNNVGTITIKTSSTNVPVLNVTAIAIVQQSIGIAPMQLVLPPTVMGPTTNLITISANSRKALALSDLQVCCDKSIHAEMKEVIPGRVFHIEVVVPAGFKIPEGQRYQISVKSNNPERPLIVLPISQFQPRSNTMVSRPHAMSQAVPPPLPPPGVAPAHP